MSMSMNATRIDQEFTVAAVIVVSTDLLMLLSLILIWVCRDGCIRCIWQRKSFESEFPDLGLMTLLCCPSKVILGVILLLIFRILAFGFFVGVLIGILVESGLKSSWFDRYLHLTQVTFTLAIFQYLISIFSSVLQFVFLSWKRCVRNQGKQQTMVHKFVLMPLFYFHFVLLEVSVTTSLMVTLLYWFVLVPFTVIRGGQVENTFDNYVVHLCSALCLVFESFVLLRNYKPWGEHLILMLIYSFGYLTWTNLLVKTTWFDSYPYHSLLSYDQSPLAYLVRYASPIGISVLHLSLWGFSWLKKCVLSKSFRDFVTQPRKVSPEPPQELNPPSVSTQKQLLVEV